MCKHYNHRLDEWIQYNLKLGFDAIVIFNNEENKHNDIDESEVRNYENMKMVTDKYAHKVLVINFPYIPFNGNHWNTIQRMSFHIGVSAFKDKCKYITLIDPDEFIFLPNRVNDIKAISLEYDDTLQIKSNMLTNKGTNDIVDNNILSLCKYIGRDQYKKIMLRTSRLNRRSTPNSIDRTLLALYKYMGPNKYTRMMLRISIKLRNYASKATIHFVVDPHIYRGHIPLDKSTIIHYHCWVNDRYEYTRNMPKIESLYEFYIQKT